MTVFNRTHWIGISLVLAFALTSPAHGQVFRCKDATGKLSFSDRPCDSGQSGTLIQRQRSQEAIQQERMDDGLIPSVDEYHRRWGASEKLLALAAKGALVMHPGPINRGVEIASSVADGPGSLILGQVRSGVAVRMALLYLCLGGARR